MKLKNKDTLVNSLRQAIAGIQKHYASVPTIALDGKAVAPSDAIATLTGAIAAIDAALAAETAFHQQVAAQRAAIALAEAVLEALRTLAVNQFGKASAVLADFGIVVPARRQPTEATRALAVEKRNATRAARGTKGKRQKAAIHGTVPAAPTPPAGTVKPQ